MPKLERTATLENIAPLVPTDEQIATFTFNQSKMKANEKRINEQLSFTSITEMDIIYKIISIII